MRTKVLLAVAAAAICVAVVVGIRAGRSGPNGVLTEYLAQPLPSSVVIEDSKSSQLRKDPEFFWLLAHSQQDAEAIVPTGFRPSDAADTEFVQKSLKAAFPKKFIPEPTDLAYGRDGKYFDVFVLTKQHRTNSLVMVLKK